MRCLLCGAEMRLENEPGDDTSLASGLECCTFKCLGCGDVEQRLLLQRDADLIRARAAPSAAEMVPSRTAVETLSPSAAPTASPLPVVEHPGAPAVRLSRRLLSSSGRLSRLVLRQFGRGLKVRSALQNAVTPATPARSSGTPSVQNTPATSSGPAEPVSPPSIAPIMVSLANEAEGREEVLRRAMMIHQVRPSDSSANTSGDPRPAVEPAFIPITLAISETGSETKLRDTPDSKADEPASVAAPDLPTSVSKADPLSQTDGSNSSPSELMAVGWRPNHLALGRPALDAASSLTRARAQSVPSNPDTTAQSTSRAKADLKIRAEVARSSETKHSASRRIVVRIQYDPVKSKYLAIDINSGFAILRHHDSARLRAICDRMNVQIDGEGSSKVKWNEASKNP